jgi:hypothetical protein
MSEYEIAKDIANIELRLARIESIIEQITKKEEPIEESK